MTDYERIYAVMVSKGFEQPKKFAVECGIPPQNLYDIKCGKCKISSRVADMIVARYPDIDSVWLLTGRGNAPEVMPSSSCMNCDRNGEYRELMRTQAELIATQRELIDSLKEQIAQLKKDAHKN